MMQSLLTEDGILVNTSETTDDLAQDYLLNNLTQTLTDEDRDTVEGEITLDELFTAIKSFANDNSP